MDTPAKLISIKEAAAMIGVTPLTLRNWDKNGKLKALRHPMNNYRVYKREEVEALVKAIAENTLPVLPKKARGTKKLDVLHY